MQFSCFEFWVREKKIQECIDLEQKFEEWHWSGHRLHQSAIKKNFKNATDKWQLRPVETNSSSTLHWQIFQECLWQVTTLACESYIHVQHYPLTNISRTPFTGDNYSHVHQHCSLTKISRMPLAADNYGHVQRYPLTKISRMPLRGYNYFHVHQHCPLAKISSTLNIHVRQHCPLAKISRMPLTGDNYIHVRQHCPWTKISKMPLTGDNYIHVDRDLGYITKKKAYIYNTFHLQSSEFSACSWVFQVRV